MATIPANPALGIVSSMQSKVAMSMTGVQKLILPERSGVMLQAGMTAQGTSVLVGIKELTDRSFKVLENIQGLLQTQVDAAAEARRLLEAEEAERDKEQKDMVPGGSIGDTTDIDTSKIDIDKQGGLFSMLAGPLLTGITGGLTAALAGGGAKRIMLSDAVTDNNPFSTSID